VGNLIPYYRRKKNIKQYDMAKDLQVSPSYLCKIEKGIQKPTKKFIEACARYLNVSPNMLFSEKVDDLKLRSISKSFKNRLWSIRKDKKIKQYELARMLNCSPSYISKVEKGQLEPTSEFRKLCARTLKTRESDIFPQ
jgi:transcriptional regulator with XRE-family HTH domain